MITPVLIIHRSSANHRPIFGRHALGGCDLPDYAEYCDRVRVVRDLSGLEGTARDLTTDVVGR
ncbi:hypothetical protein [Haloechinothrix salitolerans]|uniref:Uncharacterized protein n=1 Tax=Haloechinothrix salitolerans TaxID=926830 RepID=A0ABW2C088_9PSEU